MSRHDHLHHHDKVAGTVLSKEFYANHYLKKFMQSWFWLKLNEWNHFIPMVLPKIIFKLLLNSKEDYQYTSTEFAWLLDMVNYTLQVSKTIVEAELLCQHINIHSERRRFSGLWKLWLSSKHFSSFCGGISTFLGILGSWRPASCGRCPWADWQHHQYLYSLQVVFRCFTDKLWH